MPEEAGLSKIAISTWVDVVSTWSVVTVTAIVSDCGALFYSDEDVNTCNGSRAMATAW